MARKLAAVEAGGQPMGMQSPTDGANGPISFEEPYAIEVTLRGTSDLLFHAWNVEAIEEQANARKGSRGKKTDNVESYVFRDRDGYLCMPGRYLRAALVATAKFRQDPRSPRKSAMDLYKAALVPLTELAQIGPTPRREWDFLWRGRHVVQRNGVNRTLPGFLAGWEVTIKMGVLLPEYVRPDMVHDLLILAGRVNGISEMRPTYGRFVVAHFDVGSF